MRPPAHQATSAMLRAGVSIGCIGAGFLAACAQAGGQDPMAFSISSTAFASQAAIPASHTCDGEDRSPALQWTDPPDGAKSFALIADDPDAPVGTWVHWVYYNIPVLMRELSEGVPKTERFPDGSVQGMNDFRRIGYGGPCPPPGTPHRYVFKLYALDTILGLSPRATKAQVEQAMKGHVLAEAQLIGLYRRR